MQVHDAYDSYDALLQPYAYARARAHAHAGSTVSKCHMRHDPPGMGRGVPPDRWAGPAHQSWTPMTILSDPLGRLERFGADVAE
jgi:hypothetical protein